MTLLDILKKHNACSEAIEWAEGYGEDLRTAWEECPRGDWLLWIAGRLDVTRTALVLAACACARLVLRFVPAGEERPLKAIETAEAWCRGEATLEDVRTATAAAYAADASYATYAATAATYAARAAYAAAHAGYAARAYAAAATYAAADAARSETLTMCAEIVRKHIPFSVIAKALANAEVLP